MATKAFVSIAARWSFSIAGLRSLMLRTLIPCNVCGLYEALGCLIAAHRPFTSVLSRKCLWRPAPTLWQSGVFQRVRPFLSLGHDLVCVEWLILLDRVVPTIPGEAHSEPGTER
jgi:hypothetical protein